MESGEPSTQIKHPTDESLINSYDFIHISCNNNFSSVLFGFLLITSLAICDYAFLLFSKLASGRKLHSQVCLLFVKSLPMRICFYIIVNILKSLSHEPSLATLVPMSLL